MYSEAARPYGVSFARATASASVSNSITESTGPKISSRATLMSLRTPSKIVGGTNQPPVSCRIRSPPVTTRAPSSRPIPMYRSTVSMWPREMSAPILVAGSSGSPTGQLRSSATDRLQQGRPSLDRWTISREPALQFSPMFQKIATATFAATPSRSAASSNTICGLLPPSSSRTRLRLVSAE